MWSFFPVSIDLTGIKKRLPPQRSEKPSEKLEVLYVSVFVVVLEDVAYLFVYEVFVL